MNNEARTYNYYNGNNRDAYIRTFLKNNPEFKCQEFLDYVCQYNRGDRDSGELQYIAKHEILRLAYEFAERRWRFPNCYGEENEGFNNLSPLRGLFKDIYGDL